MNEVVWVARSSLVRRQPSCYHTSKTCGRFKVEAEPVKRSEVPEGVPECQWCSGELDADPGKSLSDIGKVLLDAEAGEIGGELIRGGD